MTYTSGSLIEAADYNGFVSTNANANINDIWSVGSSDKGYGESAVANVSAQTDIAAPNWATLVNRITSIASHTGTAITSRSAPVTGDLIQILVNVNTDLTNCTTNRGNAVASGTQYTAWTGTSGKTGTTTGENSTIVFNHTITFANASAARYFFNAGGIIKWQVGKSSTGQQGDPEWNDLAGTLSGSIFFTGRVNGQTANIASTSYTGTTKSGGTGTPTILTTTTGYYQLTASNTILYKQFADSAPYTTNYIQLEAKTGNAGVTLDLTTTWFNAEGDTFSGGTAPSGVTFGTAPATIVTYFPPSSTDLTGNAWGTPTVAATTV